MKFKALDNTMKDHDNLTSFRCGFFMAPELKNSYLITKTLEVIKKRWPQKELDKNKDDISPIFIFSAGWGTGSTLLQRLILSSNEILIWGEALGEAGIIPRLSAAVSTIRDDWPGDHYFKKNGNLKEFSKQWVANLTPPIEYFRQAQRTMFIEWFGQPAKNYGVRRWGFKEVRLTIDHAHYLQWLFPNARFLFLYRNLINSYQSYKPAKWYAIWPYYRCKSPFTFAIHWKHLLKGYMKGYKSVNGRLIKYEDLISKKIDLQDLAKYLGLKSIDESIMDHKIGSRAHRTKLNFYDRTILRAIGGNLLKEVGYDI